MITNCPVCGKLTCIHWPEHWVYRRGSTYYCSENCMEIDMTRTISSLNKAVKRRKEQSMTKITLEQKKKAVEIAVSGGNPLEYLKKCGSKKPDGLWYTIKESLKKVDPETYAKIPDFRGKTRTAKEPKTAGESMDAIYVTAEDFFKQCEDAGIHIGKDAPPKPITGGEWEKLETPEAPKRAPLQYDGYTVCCIESKTFGRFYWDRDHNHLDWTTAEGEEVSFTPTGWKTFLEEVPKVAEILGVEL